MPTQDPQTDVTLKFWKLGFIYGWIATIMEYTGSLSLDAKLRLAILIITLLSGLVIFANNILTFRTTVQKFRSRDKQKEEDESDS